MGIILALSFSKVCRLVSLSFSLCLLPLEFSLINKAAFFCTPSENEICWLRMEDHFAFWHLLTPTKCIHVLNSLF